MNRHMVCSKSRGKKINPGGTPAKYVTNTHEKDFFSHDFSSELSIYSLAFHRGGGGGFFKKIIILRQEVIRDDSRLPNALVDRTLRVCKIMHGDLQMSNGLALTKFEDEKRNCPEGRFKIEQKGKFSYRNGFSHRRRHF